MRFSPENLPPWNPNPKSDPCVQTFSPGLSAWVLYEWQASRKPHNGPSVGIRPMAFETTSQAVASCQSIEPPLSCCPAYSIRGYCFGYHRVYYPGSLKARRSWGFSEHFTLQHRNRDRNPAPMATGWSTRGNTGMQIGLRVRVT
jgi:hypothetical protein